MDNLPKLANAIMQILEKRPRGMTLSEYRLFLEVREYLGDDTIQLSSMLDAVNFLKSQGAVKLEYFLTNPGGKFARVRISSNGRFTIQLNRDWPSLKESLDKKHIQEIRIDQVSGDVQISQSGNNVLDKSETEIEISFHDLKGKILSDAMLSEVGKEAIIENVEILEEEENKSNPDRSRAQRAYGWIKAKAPPFVKDIVVNLIANLIAQGIITILSRVCVCGVKFYPPNPNPFVHLSLPVGCLRLGLLGSVTRM